jgi:hypothetical protein
VFISGRILDPVFENCCTTRLGGTWREILALEGRVSGQCNAPAALFPQGKDTRYPLLRRLGRPQSRSGHGGHRKNPLPLPGIELRLPGCPIHSPTLHWLSYPGSHRFVRSFWKSFFVLLNVWTTHLYYVTGKWVHYNTSRFWLHPHYSLICTQIFKHNTGLWYVITKNW